VNLMKCDECGSRENEFDEVMGERVCSNCGLVLVVEFEETVHVVDSSGELAHSNSKHLGSVITGKGSFKLNRLNDSVIPHHITVGMTICNMALSAVTKNNTLKDRVEKIYMECHNAGLFPKTTYEDRGTAIVFYALKENGTPLPIKDVCSEFDCDSKMVMRIVRKINKHYRNRISHTEIDPAYYLNLTVAKITPDLSFHRQCMKTMIAFERVVYESNFNKSRCYYPSICWIAANVFVRKEITKKLIAEKTGYNPESLYQQTKSILALIGLKNVKEIQGKEIEKIGE
jgi:transcription initiation factor TFIIIB Brf1 subunit/transcription initiation factor TFIIB